MEQRKKWDLIALSSIPLIMTLGNSMLIPILPVMENKLSITSLQTSMIITVYSIIAIILIPIAGFLSDRFGRKLIIIPSLLIAGVGGLISGWAAWKSTNPYMMILVGRFLQGVGAAGAAPIVMPLVGDMFKDDSQVSSNLGIIETANTFGKVLSPILGAFLATLFWYLPFFATPFLCMISLLLVLFLVKVPNKQEQPQSLAAFKNSIVHIFRKNGRWLYSIFAIGIICMFILFGVQFYLSSLLERTYHIDGIKKGLILAIPLAALCLTSYVTGKYIGQNKIRMKWITFVGLLLVTGGVLWMGFLQNLSILLVALSLCGVGIGATLPSLDALVTEGFDKTERGTITSIYSSMRFIGVALGPPLFAILITISQKTLFFTATGVSILAVLLSLLAIRPSQSSSSTQGTIRHILKNKS
ncbi:ACDE family multidrug resistance protein [Aneurinibacillus soli]|uniref:Bacillibactin exporter n=1 Tax=Aneurinibacillus soli TaxID=1500254 RepID=A0A0U5AX57_9BACL|nr:MFS transporter [Aneurinibacillus soli]PYE64360.1 ACDE family multidrug resistance protein [Aneurinibacillus soli]BAU28309.1 Bacillibactin exporter [Aneurinibacillus soli]